jgi:D-xylonolactonase
MRVSAPEIVSDDANRCGEGPIWDAARRRLLWTDIPADTVHELTPAGGGRRSFNPGVGVSAIALNHDGSLLFGGAAGLSLWNEHDGGTLRTIVAEYEGERLAINDMIADPRGRIYAGTVYWGDAGMEKHGKLYLIDQGGTAHIVEAGIELANGLGFSPDDRTLYFADSAGRRIYACDVAPETGMLSRRRTFAQMTTEDGIPDGLTVDAEGFVWCAMWYGGQVVRYDPSGRVERRIPLPVRQTSSLAFGGEDGSDLYVTTAAEPWPSPLAPAGWGVDAPQGGPLYRLRTSFRGRPEHLARFEAREDV